MSRSTPTVHRPTARVAVPAGLVAVLLSLLWLSGNGWFLLLAGATTGAAVASATGRARLDGLTVTLSHPPRVVVGDQLGCVLTVTNRGPRPSSPATLWLRTAGLADLTAYVGPLVAGESVRLTVDRRADTRAVGDRTVAHLLSRPSLGLVMGLRVVPVPDHVVVHPRLHAVPAARLTSVSREGSDGPVVTGAGAEVVGVREWRPGEERRRVHWRSTARTGRVTLLERGTDTVRELRLVLVGSDRSPDFEDALAEAASWCDTALRSGSGATVVVWHVSGPVLSPSRSRWDLLDWWSTVHGTVLPDPAVFGSTLTTGLGAGEVLVAGPADVDERWLAAARSACPGLVLHRLGGDR